MEQLSYKLETFEGPLDLLLHLIKSNKVNIYDIPIAEISHQYLEYLDKMKQMDLDIASEFLIMAAELLYIKSKMLLPAEKNEAGETIDPRTELVEKLLEYQKYKELAEFLKEREDIGRFSFVKGPEKIKGIKYSNTDLDVSMKELLEAFSDMMERLGRKMPPPKTSFVGIVARETVSLKERIAMVQEYLSHGKKTNFLDVFLDNCTSRPQIVVTFLAILELVKQNSITFGKDKNNTFYLIYHSS
ncbi:ScpA family protein [Acetivibrio sp. MSJd-27]|uniref:segregation and condensation protein A n=1 Tax=Acetivibrio sp. MSJd-27 TaxID=2841523 RepID=UPI001C124B02|nr:segregation/condensation protein A [Acetivibrio sp. MSJd-27]MBU5451177.1 segregation/condensation protein A [Acetivibrio sp. MSJd-27]